MTALPRRVARLRSDAHLLARFRAGDDTAFSLLHQRHGATIRSYAAFMLRGTPHDPDDAAQDVFLRAYEALRRDVRPIEVRPWLFRVAHNRCIDALRRPVATELHDHHLPTASGLHVGHEQRESLRALLRDIGALPERQRSALLLRELGGLSHEAVAEALGITASASKMLVVRARVTLTAAADARSATCDEVRERLAEAADAGRRPRAADARHARECAACAACQRARASLERELALLPGGGLGLLGLLGAVTGSGGGAKIAATVCCALAGAGAVTTTALQMQRPAPPASRQHVQAAEPAKGEALAARPAAAVAPVRATVAVPRPEATTSEPIDAPAPDVRAPAEPMPAPAPKAVSQPHTSQPRERIDLAQLNGEPPAEPAPAEPAPAAPSPPKPSADAPADTHERIDLATFDDDDAAAASAAKAAP